MLVEIVDHVWVDPWSVTFIKKIDEGKCALWVTGQSALEGFVLDYDEAEVAQAVNDARKESDSEEVEEPGDEEDKGEDDDGEDDAGHA